MDGEYGGWTIQPTSWIKLLRARVSALPIMNDENLIESLLPAVEQQLGSPQTPYVKETFVRLVEKESISPDEAKEMIALCLADESNRMFIDKRDFDVARYQELLEELPAEPSE